MATTHTTADGGAFAIRPARLNIFARPDADHGDTSPDTCRARGVFDDAAACRRVDELAGGFVAASDDRGGASAPRRLAYLLALAAATAAVIIVMLPHPRSHSAVTAPAAPSLRDWQPPRAGLATQRRSARPRVGHHRRARTHHASARRERTTSSRLRSRRLLHRAPAPRATSPVWRRSVPAPARPVPTRVAPDAPPEFM